jgi:hypothetical protein
MAATADGRVGTLNRCVSGRGETQTNDEEVGIAASQDLLRRSPTNSCNYMTSIAHHRARFWILRTVTDSVSTGLRGVGQRRAEAAEATEATWYRKGSATRAISRT